MNCPNCNSENTELIEHNIDYDLLSEGSNQDIYVCKKCGEVFFEIK